MSTHPKPTITGPLFATARSTDKSTSHEAADRMNASGAVSEHEAIIVDVLRQIGPATTPEIACGCRLAKDQVFRRMAGLTRKGMVEAYRKRACRTDGVNRTEWRAI